MKPLDYTFGVTSTSYDLGYLFLDPHIAANIELVENSARKVKKSSNESIGTAFFKTYLSTFPADFIIRILSIGNKLISFPFTYQLPPQGLDNYFLKSIYSCRVMLQKFLDETEILLFGSTVIVLFFISFRVAFYYLAMFFG